MIVSSPYSSSSAVQPPLAEIERVELAVEVAPVRLRHAASWRRGCRRCPAGARPSRIELHRRDAHAFLEAFGGRGVEVAGHVAADVEPVPDRGEPAEQLAVAKQRPHQPEVVEMRAAVIGIVEQIGVAGLAGRRSRATLSITAFTANAIAPTKIGRPDVPCTSVAPVSA